MRQPKPSGSTVAHPFDLFKDQPAQPATLQIQLNPVATGPVITVDSAVDADDPTKNARVASPAAPCVSSTSASVAAPLNVVIHTSIAELSLPSPSMLAAYKDGGTGRKLFDAVKVCINYLAMSDKPDLVEKLLSGEIAVEHWPLDLNLDEKAKKNFLAFFRIGINEARR